MDEEDVEDYEETEELADLEEEIDSSQETEDDEFAELEDEFAELEDEEEIIENSEPEVTNVDNILKTDTGLDIRFPSGVLENIAKTIQLTPHDGFKPILEIGENGKLRLVFDPTPD